MAREQGCTRYHGEMRFATKEHIDHIEHDGEMDWEERRLTGDGSPYLVGMPVAGRDERPRSSAVGAWTAASAWI